MGQGCQEEALGAAYSECVTNSQIVSSHTFVEGGSRCFVSIWIICILTLLIPLGSECVDYMLIL